MHTQLQGQTDRPLPPPLLPSTCCSAALVPQARLQGHRHYVQGVAWDPLGAWMISQSADRYTHTQQRQWPLQQAGGDPRAATNRHPSAHIA